ncbi:MAG TPA: glycosyltransferase family 2 protein [Verrucomicrobiae bacterium]
MSISADSDREHLVTGMDGFNLDLDKAGRSEFLQFTLVIPALNEEEALPSTLERALAARHEVLAKTPVAEMSIVLVNDGSTDATRSIADRYQEVIKIHFEKNRGYGAAIKAGFRATGAHLLGFMDADGTCDPRFCVELINAVLNEDADMSVGSRMNESSKMPVIRRLGNSIFARLIGTVSGKKLTDCASGMRVLRRSSLRQMHPLPNGLHFTPAMTCLALHHSRLKITEVPMRYEERIGHSKLGVIKDGFKFLFTILFTAALFNPIKSLVAFGFLFLLFGLVTCVIGAGFGETTPVLLAWCGAFIVVMLQAVFIGFLSHQTLHMLLGPWRMNGFGDLMLQRYFGTKRMFRVAVVVFLLGLAAFILHAFFPQPWRTVVAIASALAVVFAGWTALAAVILRFIWVANERRNAEHEDPFSVAVK